MLLCAKNVGMFKNLSSVVCENNKAELKIEIHVFCVCGLILYLKSHVDANHICSKTIHNNQEVQTTEMYIDR